MGKSIFTLILLFGIFVLGELTLTSCSHYCPAVTGTGNTASAGRHKGGHCAGVKSTGTIKPKRKRVIEDGNFDPKMAKAMAKAERKKAKKIDKKQLSADQ